MPNIGIERPTLTATQNKFILFYFFVIIYMSSLLFFSHWFTHTRAHWNRQKCQLTTTKVFSFAKSNRYGFLFFFIHSENAKVSFEQVQCLWFFNTNLNWIHTHTHTYNVSKRKKERKQDCLWLNQFKWTEKETMSFQTE